MIRLRKTMLGVAGTGMAVAALTAVAPAASAATAGASTARTATVVRLASAAAVHPDDGWIGDCYPVLGSDWAGGWCDGNGPDWVYEGYVDCTDGGEYYGVVRWAGDRRGSYVDCPSGTYALDGGLYDWYQ